MWTGGVATGRTSEGAARLAAAFARCLAALLFALGLQSAAHADDLPSGGTVAAGNATISGNGSGVTINQSTSRAVINWNSFSVGAGNSVEFHQPGSDSATLNRVTGDTGSEIAGHIAANGKVYLVNPNGIQITSTGTVAAAGFVASTLDVKNDDFMTGKDNFAGKAGAVSNKGRIDATTSGMVALLGGQVDNDGVISAPAGKVALGTGEAVTLDVNGDKFLQVTLPASEGQVTVAGSVNADGGRIEISAGAAKAAVREVVNISGTLTARSVGGKNGAIIIGGGDGGVIIAGTVDASAIRKTRDRGGKVEVSGGGVSIGGTVDASGAAGGSVSIKAERGLALAGEIVAAGLVSSGGTVEIAAKDRIVETATAAKFVSGAKSGGVISVAGAANALISGLYAADGGETGGRIDVTAADVTTFTADFSATGGSTGGLVRIGGGFQGGKGTAADARFEGRFGLLPALANAATTFLNDSTTIDVSSARGAGGTAIVWSDTTTTMLAAIRATGASHGGAVEISSADTLRQAELSRVELGNGALLLDPKNIIIGDGALISGWTYRAIFSSLFGTGPNGPDEAVGVGANDLLGSAVAISGDGKRMAIGAPGDDGSTDACSGCGAVYLFTFSDSGFGGAGLAGVFGSGYAGGNNRNIAALTANDAFGSSVALNSDATRLAVGAVNDDGASDTCANCGAVYLFTFADAAFGGGTVAGTIGGGYTGGSNFDVADLEAVDQFGSAVAFSADNTRLAVGSPGDDGVTETCLECGAVYLFTFANTAFGTPTLVGTLGSGYSGGASLNVANLATSDAFGSAVALTPDGTRLAVGAPFDDGFSNGATDSGAVYLFTFGNATFGTGALARTAGFNYSSLPGTTGLGVSSLAAGDRFGASVGLTIASAGLRLVVGAPFDDGFSNTCTDCGAVYDFIFNNNTNFATFSVTQRQIGFGYTTAFGHTFDVSALAANDHFGSAVGLSADATRLAVGASGDDGATNDCADCGAIYLFTFTDQIFGGALKVGTIGAGYDGVGTNYSISTPPYGRNFGQAIALSGDARQLAVGSPSDNGFLGTCQGCGAVYLFRFLDTSYTGAALEGVVGAGYTGGKNVNVASLLGPGDAFGISVALGSNGRTLAVGATGDDGAGDVGFNIGAIYTFTFTDSAWSGGAQIGRIGYGYTGGSNFDLSTQTLSDFNGFARSVALSDDGSRMAVGAPGGSSVGSVSLWTFTNTSFGGPALAGRISNPGTLLTIANLENNDGFGWSVALDGDANQLAVGAYRDNGNTATGFTYGAVYLISFTNTSFAGASLVGEIGVNRTGGNNINIPSIVNSDEFGYSLALSSDGRKLTVGADLSFNDFFSGGACGGQCGALYNFTFTGAFTGGVEFSHVGQGWAGPNDLNLPGLGRQDRIGWAVTMNDDATRVAGGAWGDDGIRNESGESGAVYLIKFGNTSFGSPSLGGTFLNGQGGPTNYDLRQLQTNEQFGAAVALTGDSKRLAIGAPFDDGYDGTCTDCGAVYLFEFSDTQFGGAALFGIGGHGYPQEGRNIPDQTFFGDPGYLEAGDRYGSALAFNQNGTGLAIGAPFDDGFDGTCTDCGAVYLVDFPDPGVFTFYASGSAHGIIGAGYASNIVDIDIAAQLGNNDHFGASIGLSSNGGFNMVVGATGDDGLTNTCTDCGAAYLFTFTTPTFGYTRSSFSGTPGLLAGQIGQGYAGGGSVNLAAQLGNGDQFGSSAALNTDGTRVVVGAANDDGVANGCTDCGAAYLFTYASTNFTTGALSGRIGQGYTGGTNVDVTTLGTNDHFGAALSLSSTSTRLAVGTPGDDGGTNACSDCGAVFVFNFTNGSYAGGVLASSLGSGYAGTGDLAIPGIGTGDAFGAAVALTTDGRKMVVGAPGEDGASNTCTNCGAVHILAEFGYEATSPAGNYSFAQNQGQTINLKRTDLVALLAAGTSITLQASNDITWTGGGTVTGATGGALTLQAGRSITLSGAFTTANGSWTLIGNENLAAGVIDGDRDAGAATINLSGVTSLTAGTGTLSITMQPGTGKTNATSGDILLPASIPSAGAVNITQSGATAGSEIVFNGNITSSGAQTYAGDLRVAANTVLTSSGSTVSWSNESTKAIVGTVGGERIEFFNGGTRTRLGVLDASDAARVSLGKGGVSPEYTRVYGDANPTIILLNLTAGSFRGGDTASTISNNGVTVGTLPATNANIGDYPFTLTAQAGFNAAAGKNGYFYNLSQTTNTIRITARPVTVTADPKTKVYGDADPALTYQITSGSLVGGDSFSGALSRAPGETVAGGPYTILQNTLALSSNYTLTYVGANFTITTRPVTVTADPKTKVYGDADPALTYQLTAGSLVGGDSFSGGLVRVAGESVTVSPYQIQQGTLTLGTNYAITYVPANFTITARPITITADPKTKVYGDADPTLTYQVTSGTLAFSDTLSGSLARVAGESVAGGPYAITQGSVTNANNPNYTISFVGANLTITLRPIAVKADDKSKQYGDPDPALTFTITSGSLAFTDTFSGALARAPGETIAGGPYAITQGTLALNANYSLSFTPGVFTITTRPITVTADDKTRVYGDPDVPLTYQITSGSLLGGDSFTGAIARDPGDNAGPYAIRQGTLALDSNYTLTFINGTYTISRRPIAITADPKTKVYGDADPALTYQITTGNLVGADTLSGALARAPGESVTGSPYAIGQGTLTDANNANYAINYVGANFTITTRPITVTADAKTKVYGDADPALTYQITSGTLGFSDTLSGALARAAGETVAGSPYAIGQGTLTNANNPNYAITFVGASFTITTRPITVTADPKTKVYGDVDPALTYQITSGSLAFTDTLSGALTRAPGETVAGGPYAILQGTLTNANNPNYAIAYVGANLTITARPITLTADPKSKIYGNADPALTATLTAGSLGFTDTLATILTGALTRDAGENVGPYTIRQGTLAANSNYGLSFVNGTLTIGQRPITVTADAKAKIYGDADPALTYQITTGNLVGADTLSGALARAPGETVAGSPYAIGQGTLTDTNNPNYAITFVGANFTITRRPVTVTADAKSKVYGDADPALTYQITSGNLVGSDTLAGALVRAPGETVAGSPYAIGQGTLTDANNANYAITYAGANFTITTRPITLTADDKTKVYGNADPALTYQITAGSLAFTDSFSGAIARDAGENVGGYAIRQGTLALSPNYALTFVNGTLTISQRPITVTADPKSKIYGDPDPALTYQITTGILVGADTLSGALARAPGETAAGGPYAILQGTLGNANYAITYVGANLTIGQRPITVTADAKAKTYGDADPALTYQVTTGNLVGTDTLAGALARTPGETVAGSPYAILQGTLDNPNYAITYVGANLTIGARPITLTADPKAKVYGDADPALTASLTSGSLGFSDTLSSILTGALTRDAGETVGPYTIRQGTLAANTNYALTFVNGTLTIGQRPVTVTADNKTKVYGNADPALTYQITSGNLVGADSFSGAIARDAGENVGGYAIRQGTLALSPNYALTFVNGAFTITARPITVTADNKTKVYGNADPALTFQVTNGNLVGGDSFSGAIARDAGESVGGYAIRQGTLALSPNYALTFVNGALTITARPITVTAEAKSKVYGNADPALTFQMTSGSLVGSDAFSGALVRAAGENVGGYAITQGTLSAGANYALTYVGATLTITARPITLTGDNKTKIYGNADPALTLSLTGGSLGFSDTLGSILTGAIVRDAGENVGAYAIGQGTLAANANYTLTYVNGAFTITPRAITVAADAKERFFLFPDPPLTFRITNGTLVGSDAFSGAIAREPGEDVGTYAILQGTLALSPNYTLTFVSAPFVIRPIPLGAGLVFSASGPPANDPVLGQSDPGAIADALSNGQNADLTGDDAQLCRTEVGWPQPPCQKLPSELPPLQQ